VHPIEVTDADFEQAVLKSETPVIVDFWASWCQPCRRMAPVFEELAGEYAGRVLFAKMNVDENGEAPMRYNIQGIPALVIFKGGQETTRVLGYNPKARVAAAIDSVL
jgi:thioredoxin 1